MILIKCTTVNETDEIPIGINMENVNEFMPNEGKGGGTLFIYNTPTNDGPEEPPCVGRLVKENFDDIYDAVSGINPEEIS